MIAWRRRAAHGAVPLAILMLGVAIWSGAYAAMWHVSSLREQTLWLKAAALGIWMVPFGVLVLSFAIARMERWLAPSRIALIAIASFVLANIEWLNPGHLFNRAFVAHTLGPYTHYEPTSGLLYWANTGFDFAIIIVGLVILSRVYLRSSGSRRRQAAILLIGGSVPFVASVITELRFAPLGDLSLTTLSFLVAGTIFLIAILRGSLLDVLPMARDALIEQMLDGVVVIDEKDLVVDANPAALTMLRESLAEALGKPAEALLGSVPGAIDLLGGGGPRRAVLPLGSEVDSSGDPRYVELAITPLVIAQDEPPAQLVTLHDVTEERQANESLKLARQVFDTANESILIILLDPASRAIVDANEAHCRLTGRSREDVIGKDILSFRSEKHTPEFYNDIEQALLTVGRWKGEVWQTRSDGSEFPSWISMSVAEGDQWQASHVISIFSDITEIREAEE